MLQKFKRLIYKIDVFLNFIYFNWLLGHIKRCYNKHRRCEQIIIRKEM